MKKFPQQDTQRMIISMLFLLRTHTKKSLLKEYLGKRKAGLQG